jgi:hypothetical protein
MRLICVQDYINYITAHPECTSDQLSTGVMVHRRLQDDLLDLTKYLIKYYYKPKENLTVSQIPINTDREIVIYKCTK